MALNHIVKLQRQVAEYKDSIDELRGYLNSDKFAWPNNHVNTADIFLRLREMDERLADIDFE
jgi:hypothetical protein